MRVIVEDTNIIIDLFNTGLLSLCDGMGIEFHTTRYVIGEIKEREQVQVLRGFVNNKKLLVDGFSGEEYEKLMEFIAECKGENNLSEADCSVLLLAKRLKCRLLTSDRKLKRKAEEHGIEVNGFLWLTDLLVEKHIVTGEAMIYHLKLYLETNPRAPENEVNKRIDYYNKKIIEE